MKTSISGVGRRQFFDLSHDVNTTSGFGFCQPVFCKEMMPNSKISVSLNSMVRLAPMPVPTYGRMSLRSYSAFVPYKDLYEAFDNMLASQPYNSPAIGSYVPTATPFIYNSFLLQGLWYNSYMTVYKKQSAGAAFDPVSKTDTTTLNLAKGALRNDLDNSTWDEYNHTIIYPNTSTIDYTSLQPFAPILPTGCDQVYVDSTGTYMYCIKFNNMGKNYRKILLALGYSLNLQDVTSVSLLPLFAYFKAWFDIFSPQLTLTQQYSDTNAYRLLMYMTTYNTPFISSIPQGDNWNAWIDFITKDLPTCYFYYDTDYISAHILNTAQVSSSNGSMNLINPDKSVKAISVGEDAQAQTQLANGYLTKLSIDAVTKLTKYINKNTVIGSNVSKLIHALYGTSLTHIQDTKLLHSEVLKINIGEVFNTGGVPGDTLGDYAGKGLGSQNGSPCNYEASCFGCFITFICIVPQSTYSQGLDYNLRHIGKFTFPTPEFDSLGFQVSQKNVVFDQVEEQDFSQDHGLLSSFGYIPRYFEHKVKLNVQNGDMSLRSTRNSMLPYTIDKYISPASLGITIGTDGKPVYQKLLNSWPSLPGAGTAWRQCGLYPYLNNFNRIFNNTGNGKIFWWSLEEDVNDNFIIHNFLDVKYFAPLQSIKQSFDTISNDDVYDVSKE